jgi:yjeA protein (fragment)
MILKKRYKRRLTKFGKLFFSGIFGLTVLILSLAFINHQRVFYEKDENKNYIVEINYPKVKSKQLLAYTDDYIKNKKKEFKEEISKEEPLNSSKYEFKADYKITDNNNILGLHLNISEYTGGAHHVRYDKSYYYNKESDEIVSIKDFLEKDTSLDKLANLSYYYVMKYSDDNNLNFDKEGVKEGLSSNLNNFEHFNFIDDGLEFIFPPYQIAYYAAGEIKIVIPYNELKGIIKNKYLKYSEKDNIKQDNNRDLKEFSNKKLIAFTFDDGPSYIGTNKLLDNLDKYNARVTFFVLGSRVNNYKDTLTKAYKMGNTIGSHTYSHSNLLKLDNYSVMDEIKKTNEAIKNITGSETIYLRPPYGNINSDIKNISNMYTILWDLDTEDWKYKDKDRIADYIVSNAHDGAIVLLHDLYETSVDGALLAMERLEKEGYAFVTIDEMIKIKDIQLDINKNYYQLK